MSRPAAPSPSRDFRLLATTQAEEDAYNPQLDRERQGGVKFTSLTGSIAHMVKGALGGGILSGHVAYKTAGIAAAIPLNVFFGAYMAFCLYLLVLSATVLYKRTRIPVMSYADVGEASCMLFPNPKIQRFARFFRYSIDFIICVDLFGSCCCYQIIIAKSLKQLVEDTPATTFEAAIPGYPNLRIYLAIMIPVIAAICLIRHLKYLAPLSIVANLVILMAIFMAIYYAFVNNPTFSNMKSFKSLYNVLEYIGMAVFSMSCSGVVIPIENNMKEPHKFNIALAIGMSCIILCVFMVSFFGYAAFLENCESPLPINFPMTLLPKMLKGGIALMIYVTHALNFWVPFNLCFYYLKKLHKPEKRVMFELIYRVIFVALIGIVAIVFPDIDALMGFIGCFCLSNMAFIWPNVIYLLVIWDRPGLGKNNWKLWRAVVLLAIGIFIFFCGSVVNGIELIHVFIKLNVN